MAEFQDVRPLEGMRAPLQVRIELGQMFEHWLSRPRLPHRVPGDAEIVDDISVLELCEHYRLEYPGAAEDIAETWDQSEQRIADGGPTFDELGRSGWVFYDGGRWVMQSVPIGTLSNIKYPSPSTEAFLIGLDKARLVAKTETPSPKAIALADRIVAECWLESRIPTRNPDLIAGRLWEQLCPRAPFVNKSGNSAHARNVVSNDASACAGSSEDDASVVDKAFLEWFAWCDVLGGGGKWTADWGYVERQYCRDAAVRVMERQSLWSSWDNDLARYSDVLLKTFALPPGQLRYVKTPRHAPSTLVLRTEWLKRRDVEHIIISRLHISAVSFAFRLLCSELEKTVIEPGIIATGDKVLSFAADHPMALKELLFRVDAVPALLVDMLMDPRFACLAAKLTIEWRPELVRQSDRNVSRAAQTKVFAVQDALSLLAFHLDEGALDLEEFASLITWCYVGGGGRGRGIADSRRPIGRLLLQMTAKEKRGVQLAVLRHLVGEAAYENNVPRACFAGVLDGLSYLGLESDFDALPIVELYAKFARDFELDRTDVSDLSAILAARLVETAFAQTSPDRDAFLEPFDSAKLLGEASEDELPTVRLSLARTLRAHVRMLARAIAGWPEGPVPTKLIDALLALVSRSVIDHSEKGRIGALTERYSYRSASPEVGSPAQDLAAAWRRMDERHRDAMLQGLGQCDDPVLLAQLCQHLPAAGTPDIRARLRHLSPSEASMPWTWTELQQRVESLLGAGEYGLARTHLNDALQDFDRAPSQFQLGLFTLELQLLLKEKNWLALDGAIVPLTMNSATTRQAQDQLAFYKATSELLRPNGNLARARAVLDRLAARPGAASAYKENVFALAVRQLIGLTIRPLTGEAVATGERLLAEINAVIDVSEQLVDNSLFCNRGLLLLTLQRPADALKTVALRRREKPSANLEIVAVLATHEMGDRDGAMAMLDAAIAEFGANNEKLSELKRDLQTGEAAHAATEPSLSVDRVSSIQASLQQLTELPPSQVGEVFGSGVNKFRDYLLRQVSRSVASLQHMVAMLRDRKNAEDEARFENDLNTAVREMLRARLAVVKWDVSDQSLGGTTINGNPGERDAVIHTSGQELAIYEALVCSGLDRGYIKNHFDKLLSYGICDIYFHVIYSYAVKLEPLLDYIRKMLEHEVPLGLSYLRCELLGPPDYETSGYVATYRSDRREVAVVFLIADLRNRWPLVAETTASAS